MPDRASSPEGDATHEVTGRHDLELTVDGRRLEGAELPGDPSLPALVLLHDGLGSVGLWRTFPSALHDATGSRVIAFSRYGHGGSDPPPAPRTAAFFHDEALAVLPAVLRQLDVEQPILVGHSDGASIALVHASASPVAGLVLMAPHVVVEEATISAIRETRERFTDGDLRERLARHHADPDVVFRGWCDVWLDPGFRTWTLEPEARDVECPVLLIQGADDAYGTLDQLDRVEACVRGPVRRLVVPGGHSPHADAEAAVLREVTRFVAGLGRAVRRRPRSS